MAGKGNPNIKDYAKKFSSTYQPTRKNGRKPKLYNAAKRGYNLGIDEFREVVAWLMQLSTNEVQAMTGEKDTPIWVLTICRALVKSANDGKTATLNELTEKLWGKPSQKLDVTTNGREIVQEPVIINRVKSKEDIQE